MHHDPRGKSYADPAELSWRIVSAAQTAGLGLTLLPVFYAHGNFNGAAAAPGQRRFLHSIYTFEKLLDAVLRRSQADDYVVGVAPHSLRAVTREELAKVVVEESVVRVITGRTRQPLPTRCPPMHYGCSGRSGPRSAPPSTSHYGYIPSYGASGSVN